MVDHADLVTPFFGRLVFGPLAIDLVEEEFAPEAKLARIPLGKCELAAIALTFTPLLLKRLATLIHARPTRGLLALGGHAPQRAVVETKLDPWTVGRLLGHRSSPHLGCVLII